MTGKAASSDVFVAPHSLPAELRGAETLLGDSENPAHTLWVEDEPRLKQRYQQYHSRLRFVKNSLKYIIGLLTRPPQERDRDLLSSLFFVDLPVEDDQPPVDGSRRRKPGRGSVTSQDDPEPPPSVRPFNLEQVESGFRISGNPAAGQIPVAIKVEVAYAVRSGNPFKHYDRFDFEMEKHPVAITCKGATQESVKANRLRFSVQEPDFVVEVRGFDPHRDLKVRAVPVKAGE